MVITQHVASQKIRRPLQGPSYSELCSSNRSHNLHHHQDKVDDDDHFVLAQVPPPITKWSERAERAEQASNVIRGTNDGDKDGRIGGGRR